MIVTTTHGIEGRPVVEYLAIVTGQAILGANIFRDIFAGVRNIVGGRAGAYEKALGEAKDTAIRELEAAAEALGAHAVLAVDLDYETVGSSMLMVSASGTAVRLGPLR